jgi:hypothetical protein
MSRIRHGTLDVFAFEKLLFPPTKPRRSAGIRASSKFGLQRNPFDPAAVTLLVRRQESLSSPESTPDRAAFALSSADPGVGI